jgi:hypothetical protein
VWTVVDQLRKAGGVLILVNYLVNGATRIVLVTMSMMTSANAIGNGIVDPAVQGAGSIVDATIYIGDSLVVSGSQCVLSREEPKPGRLVMVMGRV